MDIIYLLLIIFGWYVNHYIILDKPIKGIRGKIEKEKFNYLNFIIGYSVSGFLFGDEIVEIKTFGKVLSNCKRWIIIIFFTLFFNAFSYLGEIGFEISTSFSASYFISNLFPIIKTIKIPVDTIINSLSKEGFKKEHLQKFIVQNYNDYFFIYFFVFSLILYFKSILMYNKYNKN